MSDADTDARVRARAFEFLREQTAIHGDVLPSAVLRQGFVFEGTRVPLTSQQGIFKPAVLPEMPLSIRTKALVEGEVRPYDDALDADGFLRYRYRGTDPEHHENRGLRLAMRRGVPLVYLFGITEGRYLPVWPVYVVRDHPEQLAFSVAVDAPYMRALSEPGLGLVSMEARRAYVTVLTQKRVHQQGFRERVLRAYQQQCAVCRFRHEALLEAAHILPDSDPRGEPIVSNGLALCALHHAAYDRHLLGITPQCTIDIRPDIRRAIDGPTLVHGLQDFQGKSIATPRAPHEKPRPDFLAERYRLYLKAG